MSIRLARSSSVSATASCRRASTIAVRDSDWAGYAMASLRASRSARLSSSSWVSQANASSTGPAVATRRRSVVRDGAVSPPLPSRAAGARFSHTSRCTSIAIWARVEVICRSTVSAATVHEMPVRSVPPGIRSASQLGSRGAGVEVSPTLPYRECHHTASRASRSAAPNASAGTRRSTVAVSLTPSMATMAAVLRAERSAGGACPGWDTSAAVLRQYPSSSSNRSRWAARTSAGPSSPTRVDSATTTAACRSRIAGVAGSAVASTFTARPRSWAAPTSRSANARADGGLTPAPLMIVRPPLRMLRSGPLSRSSRPCHQVP